MRLSSQFALGIGFVIALGPGAVAWSSSLVPDEPAPAAKEKIPPPPPAEVLDKIAAPAVAPVIKTKSGYAVHLDLSKQSLTLNMPKQGIWISPEVEAQQTVEVVTAGAPLKKVAAVLARLPKGRVLYVTEEKRDWVLTQIVEKGEVVRGWVLKKDVKPVAEDSPPQKNLAQQGGDFASAAMLVQKGKQFDDGLYAAVELAAQNGLGPVAGKRAWLPQLAAAVDAKRGAVPLAELFGAIELGGTKAAVPASLQALVDQQKKAFLADDKQSKPIAFYTWSKELKSIFQQDRLLQSSLKTQEHGEGIIALAEALAADAQGRKSYE